MPNLYHVQDDDRPMYVVAHNFANALALWTMKVAEENEREIATTDPPAGVARICKEEDLLICLAEDLLL